MKASQLGTAFLLLLVNYRCAPPAHAQVLQVLHSFQGSDGARPSDAALVQGSDGNFYGTTSNGGDLSQNNGQGWGTIFKMTLNGALTNLVGFNLNSGALPMAALVQGNDGNFYGTTDLGGDLTVGFNGRGLGTVFKMTPEGTLTTLIQFEGDNGSHPMQLVKGSDGNLYGVTRAGGDLSVNNGLGGGTIFQMTPDGTLTTLVRFDGSNGLFPRSPLIQAKDGNFYGTIGAEPWDSPNGTIFRMTPAGELSTLHTWVGGYTGDPVAGLVEGTDGNLYGATIYGGDPPPPNKLAGTVFKVTTDGALTTLVRFNRTNGGDPEWPLIQARDGNFYGVTYIPSTIFQMTPTGALWTLFTFTNAFPEASLVQGSDGNLYGTTYGGGNGFGTVFRLLMPLTLPALSIARNDTLLVLSWPTNTVRLTLQTSPDLTNWTDSILAPVIIGAQNAVADSISNSAQFYRLKQ